jgi:hypothetical protein
MLSTPVHSSQIGLVRGELISTSTVRFQLIDGFAFQNYIKIYVDGLHVGNYIGAMGAPADKYKKMIDDLEHKVRISGGNFYLDIKERKMHGEKVVEKIVHFPKILNIEEAAYDLASCQQELRDLENRASMIFQESLRATEPLEKLIQHIKKRKPADSTGP